MGSRMGRTVEVDRKKLQSQIDRNYKAFNKHLHRHIRTHRNSFALMRDGEVVRFCRSYESAWNAGSRQFKDGLFSIQKVTDTPMDLGFFSRA